MSQKAYKGELYLCFLQSGNGPHDAKTCAAEGQETRKKTENNKQYEIESRLSTAY
jgi:hypothetical protein